MAVEYWWNELKNTGFPKDLILHYDNSFGKIGHWTQVRFYGVMAIGAKAIGAKAIDTIGN